MLVFDGSRYSCQKEMPAADGQNNAMVRTLLGGMLLNVSSIRSSTQGQLEGLYPIAPRGALKRSKAYSRPMCLHVRPFHRAETHARNVNVLT